MPPAIQYLLQTSRTVPIAAIGGQSGNGVAVPSPRYDRMAAKWELIDDLLLGTNQMRFKGERWLPREPGEEMPKYRVRLSRSFLFNGYKDTVEGLVSKPFSVPVTVAPDGLGDPKLEAIEEDADKSGTTLTQLARRVFKDMVTYGKGHILVDYPKTGGAPSLAQEKEEGIRPIFMYVDVRDVIGWRGSRDPVSGEEKLTQVRIRECQHEDDGAYGEKEVQYVRVINAPPDRAEVVTEVAGQAATTLGTWELWKLDDSGQWVEDSNGTHTFPGVPLVTAYAERCGFLEADVPMQDLAELNLNHWQSYSDQRNILRYCRMPILRKTGLSPEEMETKEVVAPGQVFKSQNKDAQYGYVEHTGAAVEAGEKDIARIEDRMEIVGMKPLVERTADSTAAGKMIDSADGDSVIQVWIKSLESAIELAYHHAGKWIGKELPEDFAVDVFSDFGIKAATAVELDFLLRSRMAGEITRPTFLREVKRRGTLSDNLNVDDEVEQLEKEAAAMAPVFDPNDPNAPPVPGGPEPDPSKDPARPPGPPKPALGGPQPPFGGRRGG